MFKKLMFKKTVLAMLFAASFLAVAGFKKNEGVKAMQLEEKGEVGEKQDKNNISKISLKDFSKCSGHFVVEKKEVVADSYAIALRFKNPFSKKVNVEISEGDLKKYCDKEFCFSHFEVDFEIKQDKTLNIDLEPGTERTIVARYFLKKQEHFQEDLFLKENVKKEKDLSISDEEKLQRFKVMRGEFKNLLDKNNPIKTRYSFLAKDDRLFKGFSCEVENPFNKPFRCVVTDEDVRGMTGDGYLDSFYCEVLEDDKDGWNFDEKKTKSKEIYLKANEKKLVNFYFVKKLNDNELQSDEEMELGEEEDSKFNKSSNSKILIYEPEPPKYESEPPKYEPELPKKFDLSDLVIDSAKNLNLSVDRITVDTDQRSCTQAYVHARLVVKNNSRKDVHLKVSAEDVRFRLGNLKIKPSEYYTDADAIKGTEIPYGYGKYKGEYIIKNGEKVNFTFLFEPCEWNTIEDLLYPERKGHVDMSLIEKETLKKAGAKLKFTGNKDKNQQSGGNDERILKKCVLNF